METAKRALILADDADEGKLIQSHVQKLGYASQIVLCVDNAVQLIDEKPFQVMICDIDVADDTSVEAVKSAQARSAEMPVILFRQDTHLPLPIVLRDDNCFVIDKLDFRQMREVLTLILEEDGGDL